MRFFRILFIFVLFFILFPCSSCKGEQGKKIHKNLKKTADYFFALNAVDSGDTEKAIQLLKKAQKNNNGIIARRSMESLVLLGDVQERKLAAENLAENYKDDAALILACNEFLRQEEFSRIIFITNDIDSKKSTNALILLRLKALLEKNDSRFESEYVKWCLERPLSNAHLELYQEFLLLKENQFQNRIEELHLEYEKNIEEFEIEKKFSPYSEEEAEIYFSSPEPYENILKKIERKISNEEILLAYRVNVFRRNYYSTNADIQKIVGLFNDVNMIPDQILSDIGKAALYGTTDYFSSARYFDRLAAKLDKQKSFFAYFYAARLYDKAGRYQQQTSSRFKSALNATEDKLQFDNSLWYLLNFQLRTSVDDIIGTLKMYGSKITDSEYFDDFFESLSVLLLSNQKWQDFYKVWKETDSNFSERIAGKYAYISGRLIEDGLAQGDEGLKTRQAVDAFTKVLSQNSSLYYKATALERLNIVDETLVKSYLLHKGEESEQNSKNDAEPLLSGYAKFGFPNKIYLEWKSNRKQLSMEDSIAASTFLNECGKFDADYNVQSLRIANTTYSNMTGKIPENLMRLNFPQFYKEEIEEIAAEKKIPPYILFALIRSESFFDATIKSSAGATGLTQLMSSTAEDMAKKLKIEDYDIFDAKTNITFGSQYLADLTSRVEKHSPVLALFAYNAGLTNVRNWLSSARKDWTVTGKAFKTPAGISMDLFLETLPFTETREYGRKVVSSAVMYAWLYYNKTPAETVREMLYN